MNARRITTEYEIGVEEFLEFCKRNHHFSINGQYCCPCVNCLNGVRLKIDDIREHLLCDGIVKSYTTWTWHGELLDTFTTCSVSAPEVETEVEDRIEDMI